jgi:hypothetical protein
MLNIKPDQGGQQPTEETLFSVRPVDFFLVAILSRLGRQAGPLWSSHGVGRATRCSEVNRVKESLQRGVLLLSWAGGTGQPVQGRGLDGDRMTLAVVSGSNHKSLLWVKVLES